MSLTPFVHIDEVLTGKGPGVVVALSSADAHHLRKVLRLPLGASVQAADGVGTWVEGVLVEGGLRLGEASGYAPPLLPEIGIAQAIAKGKKVDEVIRTVTELGADRISVVEAARSIARLTPERSAGAVARWEAIARAASEQSRRPRRPRIEGPVGVDRLVEDPGVLLVAHPGATPLPDVVDGLAEARSITVAVGPEGGWTTEEMDRMLEHGAREVGLGPSILRTEHAAAAAMAVLCARVGRWHVPPLDSLPVTCRTGRSGRIQEAP